MSSTQAFLSLLAVLVLLTRGDVNSQILSDVDSVVNSGRICHNIPALALAIVRKGKVLYSKGYGVTNLHSGQNVTEDTQFQIASLTKAFTAALLAHELKQHPGLKLSSPVNKFLDDDFAFNNTLQSHYATLEDLLAHRTGIPRSSYMRLAADYNISSLPRKLKYLPSLGEFRDSFVYNDILYGLLAFITERLKLKPWKQQIRETIFERLDMQRSTFIEDVDFTTGDAATPYSPENGKLVELPATFVRHWGRNCGSGAVVSTANDMAKWMIMLLNNWKNSRGVQVVADGVVASLFRPRNTVPLTKQAADFLQPNVPETFSSDAYGLAWRLGYYRGLPMVHHSGSSYGYSSYLSMLPDLDIGVVTLMTGDDENYRYRLALHAFLMDVALGEAPWINSSTICTCPEPWKSSRYNLVHATWGFRPRGTSDALEERDVLQYDKEQVQRIRREARVASLPLTHYSGLYRHGAYGDIDVRTNLTSGALELEYGIGLWSLHSGGEHNFSGEWLKDAPAFYGEFEFLTNGNDVYGVKATSFDKVTVPVFYRQGTDQVVG